MERDRERKRERERERGREEWEGDRDRYRDATMFRDVSRGVVWRGISILLTLRTFCYEAKFRAKLFSQGNIKMVSLFVPAERSSRGDYKTGSVPQFCAPYVYAYVCASERPSVRVCARP